MTTRDKIKFYQTRAGELRSIAAAVKDAGNKAQLIEVAEDYLALARTLERKS